MLAATLALTLLAQDPGSGQPWALAASGAGVGTAVTVEGTLELSRGEAEAAALQAARTRHRQLLLERGEELAARLAPVWLPGFARHGEVQEWARAQERSRPLRILHQHTVARSYSYGDAYQTRLEVAHPNLAAARDGEALMQHRLERLGRLLLAKLGGIAVFWGVLAFLYSWLDRLTRGYMPWRLRLIAAGLGLVVPAIVLLAS